MLVQTMACLEVKKTDHPFESYRKFRKPLFETAFDA